MTNDNQENRKGFKKYGLSATITKPFNKVSPSKGNSTSPSHDRSSSSSKATSGLRKLWGKFSGKVKQDSLPAPIQSSTSQNLASLGVASSNRPSMESKTQTETPCPDHTATETTSHPQLLEEKGKSILLANLKLTGRFLQTVITKSATIMDENPASVALGLVKAILEAKNVVDANKEGVVRRLVSTGDQLNVVVEAFDEWSPSNDIESNHFGQFKSSLGKELQELKKLGEESTFRRILDHEDEQKRIASIFERVNDARILFELAIGSRSFRIVQETDESVRQIHKGVIALLLDRLKPSALANHTYYLEGTEKDALSRVICTPGTRVRIMNGVIRWANDESLDSPRLYWIFGPAGSGKTTIAYTAARRFEFAPDADDTITLGASFFCSRQTNETKQSKGIVRTIAYQLAVKCKPFADALQAFDAVDQNINSQFKELLVKPWEASTAERLRDPTSPKNYLVVIDALDEIQGDGGSVFLNALVGVIKKNSLAGLKFLVTSRPNPLLVQRVGFFEAKTLYRLQDVEKEEVQGDIRTYLVENLPNFQHDKLMEELVALASGLFIYAATVVKRLAGRQPREQRAFLQKLVSTSDPASLQDLEATSLLDRLYRQLLWEAFENFGEEERALRLQFLHTILCAFEPISTSTTTKLHVTEAPGTDPEFSARSIVIDVLHRLHAVLHVEGERILWFHKSFPDFIFDPKRSEMFSCDAAVHHRLLADCCLRVMKEGLRFNIADIKSSFLLDCEDDTLSERVKENIDPPLNYSCRFWGYHLTSSLPSNCDALFEPLTEFLQNRGLFWIEAMNLLESRGMCQPMLDEVRRWVLDSANDGLSVAGHLSEASSFALYFSASGAASSTPHLYLSTLATWPRTLDPCRQWKMFFPRIPEFTNAAQGQGTALLATIELNAPVKTVGLSNDGKYVWAGTEDGLIHLRNATTWDEIMVLRGHMSYVNSVAFSHDGRRIVSGSSSGSLRVWDSTTGRIVSGSRDNSVRMWNSRTGRELKKLRRYYGDISAVAFSSDGKRFVVGSDMGGVMLCDSMTGEEATELRGVPDKVLSVAFSNDGKRVVSGSFSGSIQVWDTTTGEALIKKSSELRHGGPVYSVALSTDGNRIVSTGGTYYHHSVKMWGSTTGQAQTVLDGFVYSHNCVAFSSDGMRILSGSDDHCVNVWDTTTGDELEKSSRSRDICSVAFSSDGTQIVVGSDGGDVKVCASTTGEELRVLRDHGARGSIQSVAFSSDGKRILAAAYDSVMVLDSTTGMELKVLVLRDRSGRIAPAAISSDGNQIVCQMADMSMALTMWDNTTGEKRTVLTGHFRPVKSVAFSSDGLRIVSGSEDGTVRVWDSTTGEELKRLICWDVAMSVAFSSDGKRIVSGHSDNSVRMWNVRTGKELKVLKGHDDAVQSVAFSPDGLRIISGSEDRSVRVWDSKTGEQQAVLRGHYGSVSSVAFSRDGERIVSGSYDKTVRVWDSTRDESLKVLKRYDTTSSSMAHSSHDEGTISSWLDSTLRAYGPRYPYVRETTGWIFTPDGSTRLMFVIPSLHLPDSANILTIPSSAAASVDFSNARLGPDWIHCYSPRI